MRRVAMGIALLLAASSVAHAQRWERRDRDRYDRWDRYGDRYDDDRYDDDDDRYDRDDRYEPYWERDRYDRYHDSRWDRDYRGRWVPLAYDYSARTNRQFITLRGRGGRFRVLRIEAERGAPVITQVGIEYLNGQTQVVRLDTRLPRGAGEVIRLNGRQRINRIIVYTEPGYGGSYSVFGA